MSTKKLTSAKTNYLPNFQNSGLLETALTHRSALNEGISQSKESNERLEFLGDAVLELITTRFLFDRCQTEPEGVLTAYRSALVKTTTLARVATELGLGEKLYLSRGEEGSGGRSNPSLLADTLEAIIGAIYLDQGFDQAQQYVTMWILRHFDEVVREKLYKDPKSELQEKVQARGLPTPQYIVSSESGPDHDKLFVVDVHIGNKQYGRGKGKSKQIAQQAAAAAGLAHFQSS